MDRNKFCKIVMIATDVLLLVGVIYLVFTFLKLKLLYSITLCIIISLIYFLLVRGKYDKECEIDRE